MVWALQETLLGGGVGWGGNFGENLSCVKDHNELMVNHFWILISYMLCNIYIMNSPTSQITKFKNVNIIILNYFNKLVFAT